MKRVLLLLLLVACLPAPVQEQVSQPVLEKVETAEKVETPVENTVQCWDNSTAVSADGCPVKPTKVVVEQPQQPGRKYLEQARSEFDSYAFLLDDRMVIGHKNKTRQYYFKMTFLENRTPVTDVYVDLKERAAFAVCNIDRESDISGEGFEFERSECKRFLNVQIPVPFDKWVVKGPLEWLEEFADREPVLVEDNIQTISIGGNSKSIQPSLHYFVNGKRVVLRLDKRYHIPVKIEREGDKSVDFRETYFDVMVLEQKQQKITADWVTPKPVSEFWLKEGSK
ncbi:hypothetical protein HY489_04850 [Candidatus Woesearchaeota archaeon]|nr:hypothetical protein [Candidatus Woesearchaeota archaeon]